MVAARKYSPQERLDAVIRVRELLQHNPLLSRTAACDSCDVDQANFIRWSTRLDKEGTDGLKPKTANCGTKRLFEFTPEGERRFQEIYLRSNSTSERGSMTSAAHLFAMENDEMEAALARRRSKHSLPTAVIEAAQKVRHLVSIHRQADRGLRNATFQPGRMRLTRDNTRRLWAGEQQSWDDGTINFGVAVYWPWGGCPASDKYEWKLGRFQLLLCHDDATSFIPSWTYVIRERQSYGGADVAGAILRTARDIGLPERLVLEGGAWQSKRAMDVLDTLGIRWINAKGNPQRKLVENYFNRLWDKLSQQPGQVGRYRGEMREESLIYAACQAGRKNPKDHFPTLDAALAAIEGAVALLNGTRTQSSEYGSWIPEERYMNDLAAHPRPKLSGDWLHLAAPVSEERTVSRGMVRVTASGPFGLPTKWHFAHPELRIFDKQKVRIYFDPLGEAPVKATVVLMENYAGVKAGSILCEAESIDPILDGTPDNAAAITKALRSITRREYRSLEVNPRTGQQRVTSRESEVRGIGARSEIISRGANEPSGRASWTAEGSPEGASRTGASEFKQPRKPSRRTFTPDPTDEEIEKINRLEAELLPTLIP